MRLEDRPVILHVRRIEMWFLDQWRDNGDNHTIPSSACSSIRQSVGIRPRSNPNTLQLSTMTL